MRIRSLGMVLASAMVLAAQPVVTQVAVAEQEVPDIEPVSRMDFYNAPSLGNVAWDIGYPVGWTEAKDWTSQCTLDGAEPFPCDGAVISSMRFTTGAHTLTITPIGGSAERGTPYPWHFMVDVTPPRVELQQRYPLVRHGQDIVIAAPELSDPESGITHVHCRLEYPDIQIPDCEFPLELESPASRDHELRRLKIEVVNQAGLSSIGTVELAWDFGKPYTWMTRMPRLMDARRGLRVKAYDTAAHAPVPLHMYARYRTITPRMHTSPWRYPDAWNWTRRADMYTTARSLLFRFDQIRPGHYGCIQAGARDSVGHSDWQRRKCVVRPWDDRQLRRRGDWTELSRHRAYLGTALKTKQRGATLILRRPTLGRSAAILVRKCPHCGTIQLIGPNYPYRGYPLKNISLRSKKTGFRHINFEWANARYRGDYRLKVVSSGKPVVIDGLAVSPWPIHWSDNWRTLQ